MEQDAVVREEPMVVEMEHPAAATIKVDSQVVAVVVKAMIARALLAVTAQMVL